MTASRIEEFSRARVVSQANPFPGLRPFESHEAALFFGRDEQCDDLLARLGRRRLVAVVGASGSGKSSLVRAGLLPALQRGYLPSAGSAWRIAVFRPGHTPIVNLTNALLSAFPPQSAISSDDLSRLLAGSSLGLVAAAERLLTNDHSSVLIVVDQFEEIFRFRSMPSTPEAEEDAIDCVSLLLGAAGQSDVPVYIVLTMRSDYLGDCARFSGLPEALNDSQFLVPRMTRDQLREAIEGPVAVGGGRIAPRLVQRLLYDVDALAGRTIRDAAESGSLDEYDHDQLPVLQHALMRVWDVSKDVRACGGLIDLEHYENPPVETIQHALDRHAGEVFNGLPSDDHRDIARRIFQRLTDRDWDNREVRRPTSIVDLVAIVSGARRFGNREQVETAVRTVLNEFAADGRAFVVINAQEHVDISHESLIRKWMQLRAWLEQENQSRRIYLRLADTASKWQEGSASLYRGPELAAADGWWKRESPSQPWADRYDPHFETARRFLRRSVLQRRLRWSMAAVGAVLTILIAVLTTTLWLRASQAEKRAVAAENDAKSARNEAVKAADELKEARVLEARAREAEANGNAALAQSLKSQAQQLTDQSNGRQVLTPSEAQEVERLRAAAVNDTAQIGKLQSQYDDVTKRLDAASIEVNRLKDGNTALARDRDALNDQLTKARADLKASSDERNVLMAKLDDALAKPGTTSDPRPEGNYRDIFERAITLKNRKQWRDAEKQFEAAARLKGDTGEPVAMQGLGTEPYLPNYQLAFVRRQLACDALQRAEKDGGFKVLKDASAFAEQLKACQAR
jgi:energy-coupling factor transporter ATP-binding protein EcfA2